MNKMYLSPYSYIEKEQAVGPLESPNNRFPSPIPQRDKQKKRRSCCLPVNQDLEINRNNNVERKDRDSCIGCHIIAQSFFRNMIEIESD